MEATCVAVGKLVAHARTQLEKRIVGQSAMLEHCLAALLAGGHVLLEGVPGLAKTLIVKSIGELLQLRFQRIQGTSDMMPADLLGTNIFHQSTGTFELHRGPLFSDVVLVDEINRMPPRTQAALLEAMEERQITIDGVRHPLDSYFTVFATQNPVEFEGTYPLPEAQLDRFLLKVIVPYPGEADELRMLQMFERGPASVTDSDMRIEAIPTETLAEARREVTQVIVEATVMRYISSIARSTRTAPQISLGASPRAALSLLYVAKAMAAMNERNYVIPDDVKEAVLPVFRHRIMLRPDAQLEGLSPDQVLTEIVRTVAVPK